MSYNKKDLNVMTLLLVILIFICIYLINSQIPLLVNSYFNNSKTVYSRIIPIEEQNKEIEVIKTSENIRENLIRINERENTNMSTLVEEMLEAETQQKNIQYTTQRQVLNANKSNKWRIQIPKLGLDVHIEEGTNSNVLLQAVGHFEGTPMWDGNVCLAGHNRGYLCNFFQMIKTLNVGDEIIYYTSHGKRIYKVETNKVIQATNWSYIKETDDNRITLITCEENRGDYRRCVQAVEVITAY